MSNILVINAGSTSVKYAVFKSEGGGLHEIGRSICEDTVDYEKTVKRILRDIGGMHELVAVGHRVVHGGEFFSEPVEADEDVLEKIESLSAFAPLHNPFNASGIRAAASFLPDIPQIAVFDTAFFRSLPFQARVYALPRELSKRYKLERYGFHGISHEYAFEEAAARIKSSPARTNAITLHLGGGWSAAAIEKGRAVDTSMGMTPMEGLCMMTRSGDIDPGIIFELCKRYSEEKRRPLSQGWRAEREDPCEDDDAPRVPVEEAATYIKDMLNHDSGIKGLCGIRDYEELLKEVQFGNQRAKTAFDYAVYRAVKCIGAYWAALKGRVDTIVFTGRIGAGDPATRNAVMRQLPFLGKVPVIAVEPDEELAIARKILKMMDI